MHCISIRSGATLASLCSASVPNRLFHLAFVLTPLCLGAGVSQAQLVLNEVFENPPGRGAAETGWEYVELYGAPRTSLDGVMLLLVKGGIDDDRDGVLEVMPEIDESFDLTGWTLGDDGFLTVVGTRADGESPVADRFFEAAGGYDPRRPESPVNPRWVGAVSFRALMEADAPSIARLDNHGSSTYVLAYVAPGDPGREALSRGVRLDADGDGRIDAVVQVNGRAVGVPAIRVIDDVAWSNRAGREYTLTPEEKISETHGLNPDALSRVAYYPFNPGLGSRTKDRVDGSGRVTGFRVLPTSVADESFVYGVLDTERFPDQLVYFDGYDIEGWPQLRGPTDRRGTPYGKLISDPEPDTNPFPDPVRHDPMGSVYLDDVRMGGFELTPGRFNDHPDGSRRQFRLVEGDLNFDGIVDDLDVDIAGALLGATVNERVQDGEAGWHYQWQGAGLQQLMALLRLRGAEPLPGEITGADVERVRSLIRRSGR